MHQYNFEKLEIYQNAKLLVLEIYKVTNHFPSSEIYGLTNQLRRASVSVGSNIAEGSGKFSKADRKNYFTTARASLFECVAIVDILKESGRISEVDFEQMMKEADEISRILYVMIKNLT